MHLTPREKDKLLVFTAALLAERRRQIVGYGAGCFDGVFLLLKFGAGVIGQLFGV